MFWGRSDTPSKYKALINAEYAIYGYMAGKEKAYMVEAAIKDIEDAFGVNMPYSDKKKEALKIDDQDQRNAALFEALQGIILAFRPYDARAKRPS